MAEFVQFDVLGVPAPQGSKSAFVRAGRAVIVDGSSKTGRDKHSLWRSQVSDIASQVRDGMQFGGPVGVSVVFFLPLPASDPHRTLHAKKPDADKLVRSVLDSLTTSGLVRDDSQVYEIQAMKLYARDGHWTGASIRVWDAADEEMRYRAESKAAARASR